MRNLSRGKGISFFDDYSFYPDFILWLKEQNSEKQHILFIDPKGLMRYNSKVESKVDLHKRIKDTQKKIRQKNPEISLHSYIWSHTAPRDIGSDKQKSAEERQQEGVFFANEGVFGIKKLLQHALQCD